MALDEKFKMKTHSQKRNWIIDVVLLVGFLLSFLMGLTGVELHRWLGMALGALALYHLRSHWTWVCSVTQRLATDVPARDLLFWLVDASLASGFVLIIATGLLPPIWLDDLWMRFHVTISIMMLGLIVLKVSLHWRWIINTFFGLWHFRSQSDATGDKPSDEHSWV